MIRSLMSTAVVSTAVVLNLALISSGVVHAEGKAPLRQIGTYDYLVEPNFTGLSQIKTATKGVTFGLGTFDNLDGELVIVGGIGYRIPTTGVPEQITGDELTPFLQAIRFTPTKSGPVPPGTQCSQLIPAINALAATDAGIVAVRVRGTFTALTTRSVPRQSEPWPSLAQVISEQTQFDLSGSRAVLVGFRQANDFLGVGQPGLHLHGLTANKNAGGHVLSCTAGADVQLSVQRATSVEIHN
jgi:acetolactate decarboxylase